MPALFILSALLGIVFSVIRPAEALSDNLLVNGNFDELPFYWAYPNHFVAWLAFMAGG